MKDWLKALATWFDDPMTQSVLGSMGALVLYGAVNRAERRADQAYDNAEAAHSRINELETRALRIIRTQS